MIDFDYINYSSDPEKIIAFIDKTYNNIFGELFSKMEEVGRSLAEQKPISDSDLEYILVSLPLDLMQISEKLNDIRMINETLKLKHSDLKQDALNKYNDWYEGKAKHAGCSATAFVNSSSDVRNSELYQKILSNIITRVADRLSYSRELIMGAKKIWNARRATEQLMPVGELDIDKLPEYAPPKQTYIK
jgi:hypothetical protein